MHERISNKRENFTQQLGHNLIKDYGTICFEKLNINKKIDERQRIYPAPYAGFINSLEGWVAHFVRKKYE